MSCTPQQDWFNSSQWLIWETDNEFNFKYETEVPVSHSSRDVKQVIEYIEMEVEIKMWASSAY